MMNRTEMLAVKTQREAVDVPAWGGTVYVHELDGVELVEWSEAAADQPTAEKGTALLVRCIRDADGARVFENADAAVMARLPGSLINRLAAVANRVNGLTEDEEDESEKK
jgi:hypothetical protein